ncbi:MAG TPA: hypothetical protein VE967_19215 [Gemmatimonadaceae bacterium]|nr:hypothetical protein [Gemmatimonadaceae bacterium]
MSLFYRLVEQWIDGKWVHVVEGYVRTFAPNCTFEGPTFCSIAPPYLYERWWRWSPNTWGTGGSWVPAAEEKNW